jgi:hypothetical protein
VDVLKKEKGMDEKFCSKTTYEKSGNDFIVQIDIRNKKHLIEIGQLILKREAKSLNQYANGMLYYLSNQKLS